MLNDKALRAFERGEIQEALGLWEKAYGLALLPFIGLTANAEVINNLGFAYHKIARKTRSTAEYQKAVKYYKETIRVDKRRWQVYLNYADYYREVKNPRHAIENYELLLELNPNYKHADKIRNKITSLRQELTEVPASTPKEEKYKFDTASVELKFKPGKRMILLFKGRESSIDLNDSVKAAGDLHGNVIFSNYKKYNMYLLLDISGPSKIPGGPGYCAAGQEYNVVWLRLDSGLKLLDIKSALYDSCLESIALDPEPRKADEPRYKIRNNAVKIDYKSFSKSTFHSLYYDNNKPEAGPTITSSPY